MARDQQPATLVVSGRDGLPDRPLKVACTLQPPARPFAQGGHQVGLAAPELVEQQLGEEMVVAVPLSLLVQRNHEQVGAGELAQESARTLPTRDRIAQRASHRPQYRGLEQKLPNLLSESSQNFLSQETDDVAVAAAKRLDEGTLVLLVLQGEGGEVDPRGPPFGTLEQHREVIGADAKPHLLVQQAIGFLLGEGELLGAELVHLSPGTQQPQRQRRVGAARNDKVDVLGKMLHEEGHRLVGVLFGNELVVIEHQYDPMGQLGDLVYEHGERYPGEPLPRGAHSHENIGPEVLLFWHGPAQRLHYVPPQPDRIVVLLVEGDPGEGHLGFFCSTPLGQERRLAVAGRGAYDAYRAVQGVMEELEQAATNQLLGTRQRRPQLGLENDPGRTSTWVTRHVNNGLLCPAPPSRAAHTHYALRTRTSIRPTR